MSDLTKIAAGTMIVGAFALPAAGMSTGVANAAPGAPIIDIVEKPHHDDWDDWRGDDWRGWDGPGYWGPVQACVSATGPWGYVTGSVCI
jgi:hypothetical protein